MLSKMNSVNVFIVKLIFFPFISQHYITSTLVCSAHMHVPLSVRPPNHSQLSLLDGGRGFH